MPKKLSHHVQAERLSRQLMAASAMPRTPKPLRLKLQKLAKEAEVLSRGLARIDAAESKTRFRLLVLAFKELFVRCVELVWRSHNEP